jgi:hypothetical protein
MSFTDVRRRNADVAVVMAVIGTDLELSSQTMHLPFLRFLGDHLHRWQRPHAVLCEELALKA